MKIENIEKLIRSYVTTNKIWRSNINGDFDFFNIDRITDNGREKIKLTTSIGFARYGQWNKFEIVIRDGATKKETMNAISDYVEYFHKCNRTSDAYASGFAQHIQMTGGHAGNPVYMD